MHDTTKIEKSINLAPEEYNALYTKVLSGMVRGSASDEHLALAARLEVNGILSLEIVRTLHEISNTLHNINSRL